MSDRLLFASYNKHKLDEIRVLVPDSWTILGLNDIGFDEEIPEPYDTFEENARAKTSLVFQRTGIPCFADDSGLEVDMLHGRPGVYSARYAGQHGGSEANIRKVLDEMGQSTHRSARFVALIAFQTSVESCHFFKGTVEGSISHFPRGQRGFGYDPIFIPSGFEQTFGELPAELKNRISHRAMAMEKFIQFLMTHRHTI